MKIGFDAKRFFHNKTGLGNYSRSLIQILSEHLPQVQLYLYNPKPSQTFTLNGYPNNVIEQQPKGYFYKKFKNIWRLYGVNNQIKTDNISLYHGLSGEIPLGLPKKIKKIVTIHDLIFVRYPNLYSFFDRKLHYWKFKYAAHKSDVVVAISEQTKADIVKYLYIEPEKIKVIYQGCNPSFKQTYTVQEKLSVKEKYQLPEKFILTVGTIEKRKNILSLLQAVTQTDIPIVVIGKKTDYYYNDIKPYIKKNNLGEQVYFLKNVSQTELAILYQLATIFVYPSIFEGFGIPIIEALYSQTPVITSTGSCFSEAGGKATIYVDPQNVSELLQAIQQLWNNPQQQQYMIEKGHEFVQQFNDDNLAKQWIALYNKVIQ